MHDITTLDRGGLPGCAVASEAFQQAADAQARSLGMQPAMVWVPHPIQNRTPEELKALANDAVDTMLDQICSEVASTPADVS